MMMFVQFGFLFFILMLTVFGGSSSSTAFSERAYQFSYQYSYTYPVRIETYRLRQVYYVSQWTASELKTDLNRKYKVSYMYNLIWLVR